MYPVPNACVCVCERLEEMVYVQRDGSGCRSNRRGTWAARREVRLDTRIRRQRRKRRRIAQKERDPTSSVAHILVRLSLCKPGAVGDFRCEEQARRRSSARISTTFRSSSFEALL